MNNVDGYTAADPVPDEDWEDEVRWQVNINWREKPHHDRDGFMCEIAGAPECLALGHAPDPDDGWWDDDEHPIGWSGDALCPATKYGTGCTSCEQDASDCDWQETDVRAFWNLFTDRKAKA